MQWPTGLGGKGNEGVAAFVQRLPGAIGYVEYAYAKQNKLAHTLLKNLDGQFVAPDDETFKAAAVEVLAVDATKVTEEASFADDLDADSLDLVEFVMALEEKFDVEIPEEELAGIKTVGEAFTMVCAKIGI